ncbi:MAG: GAF domain-containing protein [Candidatus Omnitrophica bacterium]|nr:GAF domain-containing protein [Candidatus Omnitrophota bacterium]
MTSYEQERRPELLELIPPDRWHRLQSHFSRVLGVGIRTLSVSKMHLVDPSWPAGIDASRMVELLQIGDEMEELFPSAEILPQMTTATTRPLGFSFAAIPLRASANWIVGYLVIGPVVLGPRESAESFRQRAVQMGVDPAPVWELLLTLKAYTYTTFKAVLSMLEEMGNSLLEMAYQANQLKGILPFGQVDQVILKHYGGRLWNAFLDVACAATHAEGGSILLYDDKKRMFRIAAASGLPEEVVRVGAFSSFGSMAGLALERKEILLVGRQETDPQISSRMRRPELTSSLVAPFSHGSGDHLVGVLNLRSTREATSFSVEDVELLRKLIGLAQTALSVSHIIPSEASSS